MKVNARKKFLTATVCTILSFSMLPSASASDGTTPEGSQAAEDVKSNLQPLDDEMEARSTFEKLRSEGYYFRNFSQDQHEYIRFELQPGVYLTLPNFDTSTPGDKGSIDLTEAVRTSGFTTYSWDATGPPPDIRTNHKVQQIILASGIGAAAGLIGGALGGALGAGVGAWIGDNGICSNKRSLIVRQEKIVSWIPYDPNLNSRTTYHCE